MSPFVLTMKGVCFRQWFISEAVLQAAGALKPWTSKLERLIAQGKASGGLDVRQVACQLGWAFFMQY